MALEMPQYYDGHLTALTSQPAQDLEAFDTGRFLTTVPVDPSLDKGKIILSRALLNLDTSKRKMSRSELGQHPVLTLPDPTPVDFEVTEAFSGALELSDKRRARQQDPIDWEETQARAIVQAARQTIYGDVVTLLTTVANWTHTTTIEALPGGTGVKVSDKTDGDIVSDAQAAVELYMSKNGYTKPGHIVINFTAAMHGSRQKKLKDDLPRDMNKKLRVLAVAELIALATGCEVHVETAARAGSLMWGNDMVLLPPTVPTSAQSKTKTGAEIPPCGAALVTADMSELPDVEAEGIHYIKRWRPEEGNSTKIAAPCFYDAVAVDPEGVVVVTGIYA